MAMDLQILERSNEGDELKLPAEKLQWFRDAKFGFFIHWGLYSLTEDGEWTMFLDRIDVDEYAKRATRFTGENFDASTMAALAKKAGAKYSYFTTRHHDGFCLYDSSASHFTSVKTASKRDFVAEYLEGFRAEGIQAGLYYSPMDWRFPGYFFPRMYHKSALKMKEQGYAQISELMSDYGEIPAVWYDGGWLAHGGLHFSMKTGWHGREPGTPGDQGQWLWEPLKLNTMVRELQPNMLMNPRSGWQGDFDTLEAGQLYKFLDENRIVSERPWEGSDALNQWWGHQSGIAEGKDTAHWIRTLSRVVCRDGVLIMNIGPRGDGSLDPDHVAIFETVGEWVQANSAGIYETRGGPYQPEKWGGATYKKNVIYLHVLEWPEDGLHLPDPGVKLLSSKVLATDEKVEVEQDHLGFHLKMPKQLHKVVTVVSLEFDGAIPEYA